jgi:hypothetical protein
LSEIAQNCHFQATNLKEGEEARREQPQQTKEVTCSILKQNPGRNAVLPSFRLRETSTCRSSKHLFPCDCRHVHGDHDLDLWEQGNQNKESGDLLAGLPCTADNHCAVRASFAPDPYSALQGLHSLWLDCGLQGLETLDKGLVASLDMACSACLVRSGGSGESSVLEGKPSEDCTALGTLLCLCWPLGSHLFPGLVAFLAVPFPHVKNERNLDECEAPESPDPSGLEA